MVAKEVGMPPASITFTARVDGQGSQPFDSLVGAMSWVESFPTPTGSIEYGDPALPVITYTNGDIDLASGAA